MSSPHFLRWRCLMGSQTLNADLGKESAKWRACCGDCVAELDDSDRWPNTVIIHRAIKRSKGKVLDFWNEVFVTESPEVDRSHMLGFDSVDIVFLSKGPREWAALLVQPEEKVLDRLDVRAR